jgi:hypothetical protein
MGAGTISMVGPPPPSKVPPPLDVSSYPLRTDLADRPPKEVVECQGVSKSQRAKACQAVVSAACDHIP